MTVPTFPCLSATFLPTGHGPLSSWAWADAHTQNAPRVRMSIATSLVILPPSYLHDAERANRVPAAFPSNDDLRFEAFRQQLRTRGYVEGKTIAIDDFSAEAKYDRLPAFATELVRRK